MPEKRGYRVKNARKVFNLAVLFALYPRFYVIKYAYANNEHRFSFFNLYWTTVQPLVCRLIFRLLNNLSLLRKNCIRKWVIKNYRCGCWQ